MRQSGSPPARDRAVADFAAAFGGRPTALVRSPARVNLIGEHTDYNDGLCLPAAIDLEMWVALRPSPGAAGRGGAIELVSETEPAPARVDLPPPGTPPRAGTRPAPGWAGYVEGVAVMLAAAHGDLDGWQGAVASDVPKGAGLSSSASLELAVAAGCAHVTGLPWDARSMARLAHRAENTWVGAATGLLDQLACAGGVAGHALLVDCRDETVEPVALPEEVAIVVLDTSTRRRIVTSAYADRRAECARAARLLGVPALRDAGLGLLAEGAWRLDPVTYARARHVVTENRRVLDMAAALRAGDLAAAGGLLTEGHRSIRDDFAVSSLELDAMVEAALAAPGCYGARMTGGGFAGCAMALVERSRLDAFVPAVREGYRAATGRSSCVLPCSAVAGTAVEPFRDLCEVGPPGPQNSAGDGRRDGLDLGGHRC
ncbi:galactokinase [Pseudofrankia inefficax]|uniref:Galactokinase n=1 Tax=Pseudofrankia inefficax (strain DSM 45817 / CECT 9037 / DDB 130130 / EuI1c) TaxID=298654 RepID=E3IUE9_PSEI1|nr:galactokinase [Pseudofrankia inefficax]ADP83634.1 galactokinase [Pseudofrankia inefficax]